MIDGAQQAARTMSLQVAVLKASDANEIGVAFASLASLQARAIIVDPEPFLTSRSEEILALAARQAIPAIYGWRQYVDAGGQISYGPSLTAARRQAGVYTGRILQGQKPADLPVVQPTKFELVVNLKTAMALGLTVPQSILAQADEVIE